MDHYIDPINPYIIPSKLDHLPGDSMLVGSNVKKIDPPSVK
jgi:hypothetical protein